MVTTQIRLWTFNDVAGTLEPLAPLDQVKAENKLEDALVTSPDVLFDKLSVVARQLRTANQSGRLDLVGVDEEGQLTVIEIKRGAATRDAIAQILDYGSYIEYESLDELAQHLSNRSGHAGTVKIADFAQWYEQKTGGLDPSEMRPVRLVLVGVGEDDTAARVTRFLSEKGVDISLISFQAFENSGETLLARQVTVAPSNQPVSATSVRSEREIKRMDALVERVGQRGINWPDILKMWDSGRSMMVNTLLNARLLADGRARGWAKYRLNFQIYNRRHSAAAIEIDPDEDVFKVIFFAPYVDLCKEQFEQAAREWHAKNMWFSTWDPYITNPGEVDFPRTDGEDHCPELKFGLRNLKEWTDHKGILESLARCLYEQAGNNPLGPLARSPY